jgi:hypothetical protein
LHQAIDNIGVPSAVDVLLRSHALFPHLQDGVAARFQPDV